MPENYYVKSIRLGTVDVLNAGLHVDIPPEEQLEIVVDGGGAAVEGSVVNVKQEPIVARAGARTSKPDGSILRKSKGQVL